MKQGQKLLFERVVRPRKEPAGKDNAKGTG